jgi:putative transposase
MFYGYQFVKKLRVLGSVSFFLYFYIIGNIVSPVFSYTVLEKLDMKDTEPNDILEYVLKNIPRQDAMNVLTGLFLDRVMEEEAAVQAGARKYEHTLKRRAVRNGYKERTFMTREGPLVLHKPQFRDASFETSVFEKYERVEKAVRLAIAESYVQGASTRRIKSIMEEMGITGISASTVSRICEELDLAVKEFLGRPLGHYWLLMVDASYYKVKDASSYVSKALMIVLGVREDGYREVVGARIADSEDSLFWEDLFQGLKDRGLKGVEMVVSDGHRGIQEAVKTCFTGACWQMCHVHLQRAMLRRTPLKYHKEVIVELAEALESPEKLDDLAAGLKSRGLVKAGETLERYAPDLFNYMRYPEEMWRKLRTTNLPERLTRELKRRTRVVGAFPNEASLMRLAGSILINLNDELMRGYRFIDTDRNILCKETQG